MYLKELLLNRVDMVVSNLMREGKLGDVVELEEAAGTDDVTFLEVDNVAEKFKVEYYVLHDNRMIHVTYDTDQDPDHLVVVVIDEETGEITHQVEVMLETL